MFWLFLIFVFIIIFVSIYFINKILKYKFLKYIPSILPLIFGIYCSYQEKVCTENWCGLGYGITAILSYIIFTFILISCIIVDLINYIKKKKHKK